MSEKKKVEEVKNTSEDMSFEAYIAKHKPNPGLVASFKVENASKGLEPRSEKEWTEDFEAQSNKVYK